MITWSSLTRIPILVPTFAISLVNMYVVYNDLFSSYSWFKYYQSTIETQKDL